MLAHDRRESRTQDPRSSGTTPSHSRSPVRRTIEEAPHQKRRVHPLENLFSVISASLNRMDGIILSTAALRPPAAGSALPSKPFDVPAANTEATGTNGIASDTAGVPQRRRIASAAPNAALLRGKGVSSGTQKHSSSGGAVVSVSKISHPARHGSAPAPGWRSVVSGAKVHTAGAASTVSSTSTPQLHLPPVKQFVRVLSGRSMPSASEVSHQGYQRAAAGGQQPFSAQIVRKGFVLRLVPSSSANNNNNRRDGPSKNSEAQLTSPSSTISRPVTGCGIVTKNSSNQSSKKDLSQYRTAKVLSPEERALLTQPFSCGAGTLGGESPPPAAPLALVSAASPPAGATVSSNSYSRGSGTSLGVQRHLFGSASTATTGKQGKSILVPPAATCASSVSMTSTHWTGGANGAGAGTGTYQGAAHHRTDYLASAVTHSWLSKTHSKGYLMSIIGGNQYRGLSGIAGLSAAAQHQHVVPSRPISPRKYSRIGSGASHGVFSAPSAASTAAGERHQLDPLHLLSLDDDGTHADMISTCSALGWTLDEMRALQDDKQPAVPTRSYSHHVALGAQNMPLGGDISRCAVLLNRIDEELGKVRSALGDDDELANTGGGSVHGGGGRGGLGAATTNSHKAAGGFTATRKYAQGSIFERLASVGTEAHPLQQNASDPSLQPYQRALSSTHQSTGQANSGAPYVAHVPHRLPPASSVAASAVAEPANARWVGGLRSEAPNAIHGGKAAAVKANKQHAAAPPVQRSTITKTETPPTSIWGRLYAIAEKKQSTMATTAAGDPVHHHIIQPKQTFHSGKKPHGLGAQNPSGGHASRLATGTAAAVSTAASAALFHRLYEVDMRSKEETRLRKAQEAETADQLRLKRERDAIFNRVTRFRENQQFKVTNNNNFSGAAHTHNHVLSPSQPPRQQLAVAIPRSTSPYQMAPPLSPMNTTTFIPSASSTALSPPPSSSSMPSPPKQLRHSAHTSWHRAVSSAGAAEQPLWHINDDDLIPASSVDGSPIGRGTAPGGGGAGENITAPPSSMYLPGVAQHHVPTVRYTSKTLPASASHHSSLNDSAFVNLHATMSGGNLIGTAAGARKSGKTSYTTSPNLRPGSAAAAIDDDNDGSTLLAASFVLTPRGTWQRKTSSAALYPPPATLAASSAVHQQSTTNDKSSVPVPKSQAKKAPTSPLAHSVNVLVPDQGASGDPLVSDAPPRGSDALGRSSSAVSGDGSGTAAGPGSRRGSRNGSTAFHIRTSSYVAPSPQQQHLAMPPSAGAPPPSHDSAGIVSPVYLNATSNKRATATTAATVTSAAQQGGEHRRDVSEEYEEVQDRRVSGGPGLLAMSWSHHPQSSAEVSPSNRNLPMEQNEELVEHLEKRPTVAKLDFSKLHMRRKV
jgi:hypothetical protein